MLPSDSDEIALFKHVLICDEGLKLKPYLDCCGKLRTQCTCKTKGKLTIGVGRNLDSMGISEAEAMTLLDNDLHQTLSEIERSFRWYSSLNSARRLVIVSMVFNMGLPTFKTFEKTIKSIASGDYRSAAKHMLDSKWAVQVGQRANRLSETMESGIIQG